MGVVYRAYHVQLERTGAVKVLLGIAPDTDSTARFRHEAQAIAQMRHPNIVNVFDFGEYEGTPYMIIEYVPGGSLASRMKQGSMETADALKYLRGMAAGLDYAHSLATIAYEMLTGSIPFDGEGSMEVLYAQVHRDPPLPSARNSSLSPQVDAVVMRGLAKDPAARWESCTAFVDALAAALAGKTDPGVARTLVMAPAVASTLPLAAPVAVAAGAMPAQARADAVNPSATVAVPYPATAQPSAKKKSRKGLWAAIAAGVLIVLLILGVLLVAARPTLSLSASSVRAGDTVGVNASRLPANQNGEIQLLSTVHTFPFHPIAGGYAFNRARCESNPRRNSDRRRVPQPGRKPNRKPDSDGKGYPQPEPSAAFTCAFLRPHHARYRNHERQGVQLLPEQIRGRDIHTIARNQPNRGDGGGWRGRHVSDELQDSLDGGARAGDPPSLRCQRVRFCQHLGHRDLAKRPRRRPGRRTFRGAASRWRGRRPP